MRWAKKDSSGAIVKRKRVWMPVVVLLALFVTGMVWHQDISMVFVSRQVGLNREEAMEDVGLLIAHRGASTLAPENSIPAFQLAGEYGYWGAECDVSVTKDGIWVLMHDTSVDRTTNGRGVVSSFTLEEIKKLKIDTGANLRSYPDLRVPTLEEFLQVCGEYDMTPVIEIKTVGKDADYDTLVELLRQMDMEGKAVIISFDYLKLQKLRALSPVQMMLLTKNPSKAEIDRVLELENCDLDLEYRHCSRSLVDYAKEKDILLNVYTVDDELVRQDLTRRGINFITTNLLRPDS